MEFIIFCALHNDICKLIRLFKHSSWTCLGVLWYKWERSTSIYLFLSFSYGAYIIPIALYNSLTHWIYKCSETPVCYLWIGVRYLLKLSDSELEAATSASKMWAVITFHIVSQVLQPIIIHKFCSDSSKLFYEHHAKLRSH